MSEMWMEIHSAAGDIYTLCENADKPLTVSEIKKKTKRHNDLVEYAIGWLAREGKARVSKTSGARVTVELA